VVQPLDGGWDVPLNFGWLTTAQLFCNWSWNLWWSIANGYERLPFGGRLKCVQFHSDLLGVLTVLFHNPLITFGGRRGLYRTREKAGKVEKRDEGNLRRWGGRGRGEGKKESSPLSFRICMVDLSTVSYWWKLSKFLWNIQQQTTFSPENVNSTLVRKV